MTFVSVQCYARVLLILLGILTGSVCGPARAQGEAAPAQDIQLQHTLSTLQSLISLQDQLKADIETLSRQMKAVQSEAEKKDIQLQLDKLGADLKTTSRNLREIAAGADIASLRAAEETEFNLQEEVFALLRPALKEMKDMTSHVRLKSDLKDKIAYYQDKLPVTERAVTNISGLLQHTEDAALQKQLQGMLAEWQKQLTFMHSELQSAELQLDKLEQSEASLAEASQSYLKSFFQKRGLYLTEALLVVLVILLLSRLSYKAMARLIPGYRKEHRSFQIRLLDLMHRMLTGVLVILGPMVVFLSLIHI